MRLPIEPKTQNELPLINRLIEKSQGCPNTMSLSSDSLNNFTMPFIIESIYQPQTGQTPSIYNQTLTTTMSQFGNLDNIPRSTLPVPDTSNSNSGQNLVSFQNTTPAMGHSQQNTILILPSFQNTLFHQPPNFFNNNFLPQHTIPNYSPGVVASNGGTHVLNNFYTDRAPNVVRNGGCIPDRNGEMQFVNDMNSSGISSPILPQKALKPLARKRTSTTANMNSAPEQKRRRTRKNATSGSEKAKTQNTISNTSYDAVSALVQQRNMPPLIQAPRPFWYGHQSVACNEMNVQRNMLPQTQYPYHTDTNNIQFYKPVSQKRRTKKSSSTRSVVVENNSSILHSIANHPWRSENSAVHRNLLNTTGLYDLPRNFMGASEMDASQNHRVVKDTHFVPSATNLSAAQSSSNTNDRYKSFINNSLQTNNSNCFMNYSSRKMHFPPDYQYSNHQNHLSLFNNARSFSQMSDNFLQTLRDNQNLRNFQEDHTIPTNHTTNEERAYQQPLSGTETMYSIAKESTENSSAFLSTQHSLVTDKVGSSSESISFASNIPSTEHCSQKYVLPRSFLSAEHLNSPMISKIKGKNALNKHKNDTHSQVSGSSGISNHRVDKQKKSYNSSQREYLNTQTEQHFALDLSIKGSKHQDIYPSRQQIKVNRLRKLQTSATTVSSRMFNHISDLDTNNLSMNTKIQIPTSFDPHRLVEIAQTFQPSKRNDTLQSMIMSRRKCDVENESTESSSNYIHNINNTSMPALNDITNKDMKNTSMPALNDITNNDMDRRDINESKSFNEADSADYTNIIDCSYSPVLVIDEDAFSSGEDENASEIYNENNDTLDSSNNNQIDGAKSVHSNNDMNLSTSSLIRMGEDHSTTQEAANSSSDNTQSYSESPVVHDIDKRTTHNIFKHSCNTMKIANSQEKQRNINLEHFEYIDWDKRVPITTDCSKFPECKMIKSDKRVKEILFENSKASQDVIKTETLDLFPFSTHDVTVHYVTSSSFCSTATYVTATQHFATTPYLTTCPRTTPSSLVTIGSNVTSTLNEINYTCFTTGLHVKTSPCVTTGSSATTGTWAETGQCITTDSHVRTDLFVKTGPRATTDPYMTTDLHSTTLPLVTMDSHVTTYAHYTAGPRIKIDSHVASDLHIASSPCIITDPQVIADSLVTTGPLITTSPLVTAAPCLTTHPSLTTGSRFMTGVTSVPRVIIGPCVTTDSHVTTSPRVTAIPLTATNPRLTNDLRITSDQPVANGQYVTTDSHFASDLRVTFRQIASKDPRVTNEPHVTTAPRLKTVLSESTVLRAEMHPRVSGSHDTACPSVTTGIRATAGPRVTTDRLITTSSPVTIDPYGTIYHCVTNGPRVTSYPCISIIESVTTNGKFTTGSRLTPHPSAAIVPRFITDSYLSSGPRNTTSQIVSSNSHVTAGPRMTTVLLNTTDQQVISSPCVATHSHVTTGPHITTDSRFTAVSNITTDPLLLIGPPVITGPHLTTGICVTTYSHITNGSRAKTITTGSFASTDPHVTTGLCDINRHVTTDQRFTDDPHVTTCPCVTFDTLSTNDTRVTAGPRFTTVPNVTPSPPASTDSLVTTAAHVTIIGPHVTADPRLTDDPHVTTGPRLKLESLTIVDTHITDDPRVTTESHVRTDPRFTTGPRVTTGSFATTNVHVTIASHITTDPPVTTCPHFSTDPLVTTDEINTTNPCITPNSYLPQKSHLTSLSDVLISTNVTNSFDTTSPSFVTTASHLTNLTKEKYNPTIDIHPQEVSCNSGKTLSNDDTCTLPPNPCVVVGQNYIDYDIKVTAQEYKEFIHAQEKQIHTLIQTNPTSEEWDGNASRQRAQSCSENIPLGETVSTAVIPRKHDDLQEYTRDNKKNGFYDSTNITANITSSQIFHSIPEIDMIDDDLRSAQRLHSGEKAREKQSSAFLIPRLRCENEEENKKIEKVSQNSYRIPSHYRHSDGYNQKHMPPNFLLNDKYDEKETAKHTMVNVSDTMFQFDENAAQSHSRENKEHQDPKDTWQYTKEKCEERTRQSYINSELVNQDVLFNTDHTNQLQWPLTNNLHPEHKLQHERCMKVASSLDWRSSLSRQTSSRNASPANAQVGEVGPDQERSPSPSIWNNMRFFEDITDDEDEQGTSTSYTKIIPSLTMVSEDFETASFTQTICGDPEVETDEKRNFDHEIKVEEDSEVPSTGKMDIVLESMKAADILDLVKEEEESDFINPRKEHEAIIYNPQLQK